jgi:hypothetical protein
MRRSIMKGHAASVKSSGGYRDPVMTLGGNDILLHEQARKEHKMNMWMR